MTTSSGSVNNAIPSGLQEMLLNRKRTEQPEEEELNNNAQTSISSPQPSSPAGDAVAGDGDSSISKPVVLVTNSDGIESPGLTFLVQALVRLGLYDVHVCVPQSWVPLCVLSNCFIACFLPCLLWLRLISRSL